MPFSSSGPASSTTRLPAASRYAVGPIEDLPRPSRLLQPRGEVHRLACREGRFGVVDDDLARLDADPRLELEIVNRCAHRERCARSAQGVVLVCLRDAERGHHGIARELLDDAAMLDDARRDHLEERIDTTANDLGVGPRHQTRGVDDVDEQNGCELALHG